MKLDKTTLALNAAKVVGGIIATIIITKTVKSMFGSENPNPKSYDNSLESNQASQIVNALGTWYTNTDEEALYEIAKGIQNVKKVAEYYAGMTGGRVMMSDIQDALDSEEYQIFLKALNQGKTNRLVATLAPVQMFKVAVGQQMTAKEGTPIFAMPSTSGRIISNARHYKTPLGIAQKRYNNEEGNWYLFNMDGRPAFVREEHLIL